MVDHDRIISLVQTVAADPALQNRLAATPEADRSAVLAEIGYSDVSTDDVAASAHLFTPPSVEEIDDEQLASVAGGNVLTAVADPVTNWARSTASSAAT